MKRALVGIAVAAAMLVPAGSALATTSTTFNLHGGAVIDVGPAGCVAGDLSFSLGNVVFHQTVNNAGDVWITATATGTFVDATVGFTGSGVAWFGVDQNARNFATQFIGNFRGTLPDGSTLSIHQTGQFTLNANGVPVVNNLTVTCG